MEPTDEQFLRRGWKLEMDLDVEFAERVEDVGDGFTAVLDTSLPMVWDSNYVIPETVEISAEDVAAKADVVLGALGMEHRTAYPREPEWSTRLADPMVKLGWEAERDVYMVLRREPDRPAEVEVEEVEMDEVREVKEALILEAEWGTREVAEQLHERDRKVGEACRDRWFAARHEGEIAAACRLMQFGGIGKVEDVSTLEPARNRGLARAVVLEASKQSVADGDDFTFIVALSDDWPRQLYARLGFDPVGEAVSLQRKPDWVQAK